MSDSDDELHEQATALLGSEDVTWIERVRQTGFLTGLGLLALVLWIYRDTRDLDRSSKTIVDHWAAVVTRNIKAGRTIVRDPYSFWPIRTKSNNGWGWALSLDEADSLFAQAGMAWTCSDLVEQLFNNSVKEPGSLQDEKEANEMDALKIKNKRLRAALKGAIDERDTASELFLGAIKLAFKNYDPAKQNDYLESMEKSLGKANVHRHPSTIT